ncbi:WD40 repeat-like protein [Exidia glandulosa HHB12029]|uniref:WD40 repeat-like protein n=1 Tax=Exidia glandulosa HHB12029 TaxID=1314781 RepID=A0A165E5K9_EXIGL|nr:WD40 repeat-like protein [Exidia glandulosa HHB12029]
MLKLKLLADAMTGLKFLHENLIVHGDIKGGNVLVSDDGVARLCDFGLSRLLEQSQSTTHTGAKGTLRFMAPELVLEDDARHTYSSDIWTCGCLCIEVWSDKKPYHTKTRDQQVILALSRAEPPARPSNMSDVIWTGVEACCSFDPKRRPQPLHLVTRISGETVMQRVHRMLTLGRPIDSSGSEVLEDIEILLRATDPQRFSELYVMSDTELATEILRSLAISRLSRTGGSSLSKNAVFQWCLVKLGTGSLRLPAGVSLPNVDNGDAFSALVESHESGRLRPLARLLERACPGLAMLFMTQFATPALGSALKVKLGTLGTSFWSIAFLASNRIVAVCNNTEIHILDIATGKTLFRNLNLRDTIKINRVAVSPNQRLVAACFENGRIRFWDAETGFAVDTPSIGHRQSVRCVAFSPDGQHIASGSEDTTIRIWSMATFTTVVGPLRGHTQTTVYSVAYSLDGFRIVSGSWDATVRVWDARTGDPLRTLRGHTSDVRSVAYSPDGLRMVSGSNDGTIRIWDAINGQQVGGPLKAHSMWVLSVAYSPDGMHIVSGGIDNTIRIWDAATGAHSATMQGHTHWASSLAFSPDGKRLASASLDNGTVRFWDATDDWMRWDI